MRISRKKRPDKPLIAHYRLNNKIVAPEVRLLDNEGGNLGVFSIQEALRMAEEQEIDLVEVNPKAEPPVCKIIDFSHFKYQKEKEIRKQKQQAHDTETKGIRLSVRISDHDMEVRLNQADKFLNRGDKVKIELTLRGRENIKPTIAFEVVNKFLGLIEGKMELRKEQLPTKQGNRITAIVAKK
ncbi:MAG: translation initiation factor IF-3 [Candidatus Magasanikbacteria bacterium]|jgi:translation initiation factor IF-3|nr:translation initiation factor IF-3 [Candidatus Magasanikbacteria bacterium]MBT4314562.1 translation initiation factor IF-3 [Candidatus Magasanikbacteria bacterium]MBT4547460.1 translation initiation factor IF-3 [Candidatus Magasanikbacteria bacterium]MBT6819442.1 translation initiation factor IF-3 [Candidatus Magasanikbacteria bacterium]